MLNKKKIEDDTVAASVPVSEMIVDTYQGHVSKHLVDKIAANWNESAAGAVILNLREDNTYAVLDGQHRVLAAKMVGVTELPALVFIGKSRQEEAKLFVLLNTKHNVRPVDRFRANLFSGGSDERVIVNILKEVGLEAGLNGPKNDTIQSVGRLMDIFKNFGGGHLRTVVGVLTSAFHGYPDRQRGYHAAWIDAVSQFIYRYPDASVPRLIEKMRQTGPTVLTGMAESKRESGRLSWVGHGKALTSLYNAGYRSSSNKYLPPSAWDKNVFSPAGKKVVRANALKNIEKIQREGAHRATTFKVGHVGYGKGLKKAAKGKKVR